MKLEEVLPALRDGRRVQRGDMTLKIDEGFVTAYDKDGAPVTQLAAHALFGTDDINADDWTVYAPPREEGHADSEARGKPTPERPHPGYGGVYDVANLGRPDQVIDETGPVKKARYFIPHTQNEVVMIDGVWFFANPELPKAD